MYREQPTPHNRRSCLHERHNMIYNLRHEATAASHLSITRKPGCLLLRDDALGTCFSVVDLVCDYDRDGGESECDILFVIMGSRYYWVEASAPAQTLPCKKHNSVNISYNISLNNNSAMKLWQKGSWANITRLNNNCMMDQTVTGLLQLFTMNRQLQYYIYAKDVWPTTQDCSPLVSWNRSWGEHLHRVIQYLPVFSVMSRQSLEVESRTSAQQSYTLQLTQVFHLTPYYWHQNLSTLMMLGFTEHFVH